MALDINRRYSVAVTAEDINDGDQKGSADPVVLALRRQFPKARSISTGEFNVWLTDEDGVKHKSAIVGPLGVFVRRYYDGMDVEPQTFQFVFQPASNLPEAEQRGQD
jgi:hypothetical protein